MPKSPKAEKCVSNFCGLKSLPHFRFSRMLIMLCIDAYKVLKQTFAKNADLFTYVYSNTILSQTDLSISETVLKKVRNVKSV